MTSTIPSRPRTATQWCRTIPTAPGAGAAGRDFFGRRLRVRPGVLLLAGLLLAACATPPRAANSDPAGTMVQAPPASVYGSYLAGRQARADRDISAAARYYLQALEADPDNQRLRERTLQLLLSDGRIADAVALGERLVDVKPNDGLVNLVLAVDALRRQDFARAQSRMAAAREQGFIRLLGPLISAWARVGEGDVAGAMASLDRLDATPAFKPFRLWHQALIQDVTGNTEAAIAAYSETLNVSVGGAVRVSEVYGNLLARTGRTEQARAHYEAMLAKAPGSLVLKAGLKALAGPPAEAIVATAVDGVAEALYGAAAVLNQDNAHEAAITYLRLALYLRPELPIAQAMLADIYEARDDLATAIKLYRAIPRQSPYSWNARIRLGWVMNRINRADEAVALLRQMTAEETDRTDALVTLADILRGNEQFTAAAKVYGEAIGRIGKVEPRHWSLFYARGIAYERSRQWKLAEQDFLKALELRPEQPLVLNYLGYSWADQGIKLDEALAMIERAVVLRPSDGYIVDSLGWILYRTGRYREAVEHLERAVELKPSDPIINDHLGDAYWYVGRRSESCFQWRRAMSLGAGADIAGAIKRKLEVGLDGSDSDTAGGNACG